MPNRKKSMVVTVPKPCGQDWSIMPVKDNGRFCNQCEKTVVDFSGVSDQELIQFLSNPQKVSCGRFADDQLNRNLVAQKPRRQPFFSLQKPVAALLAFISLKNVAAAERQTVSVVAEASKLSEVKNSLGDKIKIDGRVTNENNEPIENATVYFDDQEVAKSDKEGRFSFELNTGEELPKPSVVSVHYPGLVKAVRSYYPTMLSTYYNIVLRKPADMSCLRSGVGTMGIIISSQLVDTVSVIFKKDALLTDSMKMKLTELANTMRNNPNITVQGVGYGNEANSLLKQRQKNVRAYLSNEEGIDEERLELRTEPALFTRKNLIQVVLAN